MLLTDAEIIKKYNIRPNDKIVDVGGSMTQHETIQIDTLVDLIKPEDAPYNPSKMKAKHFVKCDVIRERLPFKNDEFDFCLCTHTLEDLPTPFLVMDEMGRIAKRGLIVTPSMGEDMVFSPIDYTRWLTGPMRSPGQAHHKWFFVSDGKKLKIIPKVYPVLYTPEFYVVAWRGEKEMVFYWEKKIDYEEFNSLKMHDLINEYVRFKNKNKKYIKTGTVLIFLDNIQNLVKALIKKIIKRGVGYWYR